MDEEKPTVVDPLQMPSNGSVRAVPPPGTRIGQYVVERLLGTGGMGVVVAARHAHLGEIVAIKLMHAKAAKNEVQAERFAREAKQTVRIKSERVVRVLDAGTQEDTGAPYIVMEYLEGRDLGRVIQEDGPLHPTVFADFMMQVCEAVAAAHALNIVHRDLKPSNFFLTQSSDGSPLVKVLDFGISKALVPDGLHSAKLTETQAVFGSPTYMSPEQIRSSTNVDQRSDVWSLGISMFELLTGKIPFMADNVAGLLASIVADPPFRLVDLAPHVPPELEHVVFACLEKDVNRRMQSVAELASALQPFASSSADASAITGRIKRLVRQSYAPGQMAPMPGQVPSTPRSFPPPASGAAVASPPVSSMPAPALDFSKTTGTDLSATGDAALKRMRSNGSIGVLVGALAGALIAIGAVVAFVVVRSAREPKEATAVTVVTPTPPPPPAASPSLPVQSPSATPAVAESTAANSPAPSVSAKPSIRGKLRPGAAKPAGTTTAAPTVTAATPPTPNPDTTGSRY